MSTDKPVNIRTAVSILQAGEEAWVRDYGDSMEPLIHSGDTVFVVPYKGESLSKGDVVLAKVNGHLYMHRVSAVRKGQVQISNNRGKINGWTSLANVYGKVIL